MAHFRDETSWLLKCVRVVPFVRGWGVVVGVVVEVLGFWVYDKCKGL